MKNKSKAKFIRSIPLGVYRGYQLIRGGQQIVGIPINPTNISTGEKKLAYFDNFVEDRNGTDVGRSFCNVKAMIRTGRVVTYAG